MMLKPGVLATIRAMAEFVAPSTRRRNFRTLAMIMAAAWLLLGAPAMANPVSVTIEPGLESARDQEALSLIVRVAGPSLAEVVRSDADRALRLGRAPMSRAALAAVRDRMVERQAPAAAGIAAAGGNVVARYQGIVNGFLVHAAGRNVAAIAAVPGVVSVARAPMLRAPEVDPANQVWAPTDDVAGDPSVGASNATWHAAAPDRAERPTEGGARDAGIRPATVDSVPFIGAPRVWQELGWRGDTSLVAVLDTGVDYTHGAFGGPGTEEAYARNNENIVESGTFPTERSVGGYDLAGQRYSPHPACGLPGTTQDCSRTPKPDDDPLDVRGNGTHVAGIIAGQAAAGLTAGVAPRARLVPLKIFGNPVNAPVVTDLLVGAFDWVVNNNLQLDVPGFATEPIDVVFIGLTDDWLSGAAETERVVKEASDAGLVVVVAFGNNGPQPYLASPVASAESSISVGSSYAPGQHGLLYEATWTANGQPERRDGVALDSQIAGQPDAFPVGYRGQLAWMGTACDDDPPRQPVVGRIALVERGLCGFAEKMLNAQDSGALAVTVFTTGTLPVQPMGGQAELAIPGVMIDQAAGLEMRDALLAGATVQHRVWEPSTDLFADTMSAFSNRGPSRATAFVKPQIVAPGQYVTTAWPGAKVSRQTGTSMAAAHVAGAAALLAQRNEARRLRLEAAQIGALLVNYASPTVRLERSDVGAPAAITLQGAGRLDVWQSAVGNTAVRSESGIAELSFGHVGVVDQPATWTRTLHVHNLAATPKTYAARLELVKPDEDGDVGVSLTFDPPQLTVPAGQKAQLQVTLRVDPDRARSWLLEGHEAVHEATLLDVLQVDGRVFVEEVDAAGTPVPDGDRPSVPFLVLPRRHSCVAPTSTGGFWLHARGSVDPQEWRNPCREDGTVRMYTQLGTDTEDDLPAAVDLRSVSMRHYPANAADPESDVVLEFAVQTRGARRLPEIGQLRIYIDVDRDTVFDHLVWNMPAMDLGIDATPGRWVVVHGYLPPDSLDPADVQVDGLAFYQPYDLDEAVSRLVVSADDLGIDMRLGGELFNVAVALVDTQADFPLVEDQPAADYLPDNLLDGGAVTYDQLIHGCVTPMLQVAVPGNDAVAVNLTMGCDPPERNEPVTLLFHQSSNAPGAPQVALRSGVLASAARPQGIYLPYASR